MIPTRNTKRTAKLSLIGALAVLAINACLARPESDDDDDGGTGIIPGSGASGNTPSEDLCSDTCGWANDGECDDGGPGAAFDSCAYGTDCGDCGPRQSSVTTTTSATTGGESCSQPCTTAAEADACPWHQCLCNDDQLLDARGCHGGCCADEEWLCPQRCEGHGGWSGG